MAEAKRTDVLDVCVAQAQTLADLVDYSDQAIVSKRIIDKPTGTVTLFAFDAGQRLSTHQAPYDALVQVVEGAAHVTIHERSMTMCAGQIVLMPANVPHAVAAEQRFKMLLTMIREGTRS